MEKDKCYKRKDNADLGIQKKKFFLAKHGGSHFSSTREAEAGGP
jgi:hypothetical protein